MGQENDESDREVGNLRPSQKKKVEKGELVIW
jgi:hypothetical protein